jgi:malonyl-CoA decarboxylase
MDFLAEDPSLEELTPHERLRALCDEALVGRGKINGLVAVARIADAFDGMNRDERDAFHLMLLSELAVDEEELEEAIGAYLDPPESRARALARLTRVLDSPRLQLLRQFNAIPQGIKFLVDLRADVLPRLEAHPALWLLEHELRHLLESWFSIGFLRLERITWESPAALLEKLVEYEAVHAIANWRDLKRRLQGDRACFAFIHPNMPTEPVIFMEVALVRGLALRIQDLIGPSSEMLEPQQADTAIFYSITNAQRGLRGIKFGNLLIKLVAPRLKSELPNLRTFATLSPVPRLCRDFLGPIVEDGSIEKLFTDEEASRLCLAAGAHVVPEAVRRILEQPDWHTRPELAEAVKPGLLRAARTYLTEVQRSNRVACPVGHFHASNGAKLASINWLGNTSEEGIAQSAGIMVNYLYTTDLFEQYQSEYSRTGRLPVDEAFELIQVRS